MADSSILSFSKNNPYDPNGVKITVAQGISVDPGTPVTTGDPTGGPTGGPVILLANAGSSSTAGVIGLAITAGEYPGGVNIKTQGPVTLTTEQWDAVTGQSGGLDTGSYYYLDDGDNGKLIGARSALASAQDLLVGFAISPTTLVLMIGANPPTQNAEHFTVAAGGTQAITPDIATTFANAGSGSGTAHFTLANGLTDGYQKTFHAENTAECDIDITPASFGDAGHTKVTFSADTQGSVTFVWDAALSVWYITALYEGTVS
jgi:hypothetical protein